MFGTVWLAADTHNGRGTTDRWDHVGADMDMTVSVIIVCRATLVREMLEAALRYSDIALGGSAESVTTLEQQGVTQADVGVYVDLHGDDRHNDGAFTALMALDVRNWIVMGDDHRQGLYRRLVESERPACSVPMDISRNTLGHLVSLAAQTRHVCIGTDPHSCMGCAPPATPVLPHVKLEQQHYTLLDHLAGGLSNKEIARIESCTENTVKMRVRTLITKLGVHNRTQAAVMATRHACAGHTSL